MWVKLKRIDTDLCFFSHYTFRKWIQLRSKIYIFERSQSSNHYLKISTESMHECIISSLNMLHILHVLFDLEVSLGESPPNIQIYKYFPYLYGRYRGGISYA